MIAVQQFASQKRWVSQSETCRDVCISRGALARLIREGQVDVRRIPGTQTRVDIDQVIAIANEAVVTAD
jgi:hypothetical protein